jgi:MFS family permease
VFVRSSVAPTESAGNYPAALAACAVNVLAYFSIGVVAPVLPIYMRAELGAGDVSIGFVMGCYAVTTLVGRPAGGLWGDRAGFRGPAATGALLIAVGTATYGFFPSIAWLFACRLVVGLGEGLSQASCIAWAIALAPPRNRAALLSYAGVSGWAGVALGAMVGGTFASHARGAFGSGAVTPLLGLAIIAAIPTARRATTPRMPMHRLAGILVRPGGAYALVTVGYAAVITFGSLLMRESGSAPALLLDAFIGGIIAFRLVAAPLPARLGPTRTVALCATTQAACFLVVAAFASHPIVVAIGAFVGGMAFGLSFPSLALYALERVSESERGLAIGVVSAFFDVGMAVAGAVLGSVTARGGYGAAFVCSAGCAAVAAALVRDGPRSGRTRRGGVLVSLLAIVFGVVAYGGFVEPARLVAHRETIDVPRWPPALSGTNRICFPSSTTVRPSRWRPTRMAAKFDCRGSAHRFPIRNMGNAISRAMSSRTGVTSSSRRESARALCRFASGCRPST